MLRYTMIILAFSVGLISTLFYLNDLGRDQIIKPKNSLAVVVIDSEDTEDTEATKPSGIAPYSGIPAVPTMQPVETPSSLPHNSAVLHNDAGPQASFVPLGFEAEVLALINGERQRRGLPPYRIVEQLSRAARHQSDFMASTNRTSHSGANGTTYRQRIQQAGYDPLVSAEEAIGWGFETPQDVVDWWLASATHGPILRSTLHTEIGIGYSFGEEHGNRYFWVATFGSRSPDTNTDGIAVLSPAAQLVANQPITTQ